MERELKEELSGMEALNLDVDLSSSLGRRSGTTSPDSPKAFVEQQDGLCLIGTNISPTSRGNGNSMTSPSNMGPHFASEAKQGGWVSPVTDFGNDVKAEEKDAYCGQQNQRYGAREPDFSIGNCLTSRGYGYK